MKRNWKSKLLQAGRCFLAGGIALLLVSCHTGNKDRQVQNDNSLAPGDDLAYLLQPANRAVVSGIRTVTPLKKQMTVSTTASGIISYDTRRSYTVPVRFDGRVERLYLDYNFQPVRKGQKILEIYSPGIVAAQQELLYLLKSDPDNRPLIDASRQKLRLLGLTGSQISHLVNTGEAAYSLAVYSPYTGYIYEAPAAPEEPAAPLAQTPLSIREGMYLRKGQTVFKVINTGSVRAEFNIYPQSAPYLKKGDEMTIVPDFDQDVSVRANIDFLQPFYQNGENFSKIRVYLDNREGRFRPGELVTARFRTRSDSAWWIPQAAVLDLGTKSVVFIKEGPVFRPRAIATGRRAGGWIAVASGLSSNDTIAANSHYLVGSEGFVKISAK